MLQSKKNLDEKVHFDFIRYANCWEDADILLEGLAPVARQKILSIGSAGDNSFSLLTTHPQLLVAVDINPAQLYLIELKKACFLHLDHETILSFLGYTASDNRLEIFKTIAPSMSKDAQLFWKFNYENIIKGIIHNGKFEKYFQFFVKKILPFIHSQKTTHQLLEIKSAAAQSDFYHKKWNSWRWKLLFKIFFSKTIMGKFGRDPQFLNEVEVNVAAYIFEQAAQELSSTRAQENNILRYNLTANFGNLLPHYLQPENFQSIKNNLGALHLELGFTDVALKKYGNMDYMNLSNIFEYMDIPTFEAVGKELVENLNPEGRLAYWNLMVPRKISEILPNNLIHLEKLSQELSSKDKGFFYKQFIVEQMI